MSNSTAKSSFAGKVALVAGASRGIGAVAARAFADSGAAVVLAARDGKALDAVAKSIESAGGRILVLPMDVRDAAARSHPRSTCRDQIPAMLQSGGGAIVNMASLAGLNGTANLAAYVAGKAGIIGLSKVTALDCADRGIRVNVVAGRYWG